MKEHILRLLSVINECDVGVWTIDTPRNQGGRWMYCLYWNDAPIVFEDYGERVPGEAVYGYLMGFLGGLQG